METDRLVSKPLAFVIIGLILGASLGLGSGYAVFYPEMVEQSNRDLEDRMTDLEDNIDGITVQMGEMEESLGSIQESLQSIVTLSQAVNSLNTRLGQAEQDLDDVNGTIESTRTSLDESIGDLEDGVEEVNQRLDELREAWEDTALELDDMQSTLDSLDGKLLTLDEKLEMEEALEMLKSHLANPDTAVVTDMTDELFEALLGDSEFKDWVTSFGEVPAKSLLKQEIVRMTGGLVWYKVSTQNLGSIEYLVKVETFFEFEFSPASVSIPGMRMQMRGTVNVDVEEFRQVQVDAVEIL
jgi:chaperonin cofactor prefoldin